MSKASASSAHDEVDEQRRGDAQYVDDRPHDGVALAGEDDDNREEQRDQRERSDGGEELLGEELGLPQHDDEEHARDDRSCQRNACYVSARHEMATRQGRRRHSARRLRS